MTAAPTGGPAPQGPSLGAGFAKRNIWLWATAYLCLFFPLALFMYYVTYLTKVQGYTMEKAGLLSSLGSVGTLLGAPLAGILIGKFGIKHLKLTLAIGVVIYCLLLALSFNISGIAIPIWMIAMGLIGMGAVPVICMTAVPGIMGSPQMMGIGMAVAVFGANIAGMIGPPVFGAIVDKAGWNAGAYALIPVAMMGIFFAYITKISE
jgi:MFS family permease